MKTKIIDDVVVFVPEESRVREAVVRKAAGKPVAVLNTVTKKYFLKVFSLT